MKIKENKGITLVALIITVIVMTIIASIAIYSGKETIKQAKLEELRTNMLLIEAKAKEYVEQVNFKMGPNKDETKRAVAIQEIYIDKAKLKKADSNIQVPVGSGIGDITSCYDVTREALNVMGLSKVELKNNEHYLIKFDEVTATVEIYNTLGYKSTNGKTYYSLKGSEKDSIKGLEDVEE